MNSIIQEDLKKLPEKPGVYIMRNEEDTVLYVGKARILKNRVRSYFQNTPHSDRITVIISQIDHFEYIVCDSEYEALLLENNLIKNLVYSGSKQNVKLTMVNGQILYENGEFHIGFDPEEIYARSNAIIRRISGSHADN